MRLRLIARRMRRGKYVTYRFVTNILRQQCRVEEEIQNGGKKHDPLVLCWTERKYENVMFELKWDVFKILSSREELLKQHPDKIITL